MPNFIFTPWKNESELLAVRSQFYPPGPPVPDLRTDACRTVGAWKLRGNLPHSVEATALLTDAILHDDATKNSIFSIKATYTAAFCRFVTGLVDSKSHGRKKSMFQRAFELGLPASFVELRHEATHRELPSLVVLRRATHRSLEWLWGYYWAKIDAPLVSPAASSGSVSLDDAESVQADIRHILSQWMHDRSAEPPRKKQRLQQQGLAIVPRLIAICKNRHQGSYLLSRYLLEGRVLVLSDPKLDASLDHIFIEWDPLLEAVSEHIPSFLTVLAEEMVNELISSSATDNTKDDPYREGVYMWLDHILTSETWNIHKKRLSLSYILAACQESPNFWMDPLSETLRTIPNYFDLKQETSILERKTLNGAETSDRQDTLDGLKLYGWECR
ncbi:Las1-like domain containing protein [Elaphomyces granulatus]